MEYLKPESFGLSNSNCRHKKVINTLDERGFKPLGVLNDDPGFTKLNWFTHFRLKTSLEKLSSRNNLKQTSTGVTFPSDKTGRTPDYVSCDSKLFKWISKGSSYYRRILLLHNPKCTTTYKSKMEIRLGVTLKQSYVNHSRFQDFRLGRFAFCEGAG